MVWYAMEGHGIVWYAWASLEFAVVQVEEEGDDCTGPGLDRDHPRDPGGARAGVQVTHLWRRVEESAGA